MPSTKPLLRKNAKSVFLPSFHQPDSSSIYQPASRPDPFFVGQSASICRSASTALEVNMELLNLLLRLLHLGLLLHLHQLLLHGLNFFIDHLGEFFNYHLSIEVMLRLVARRAGRVEVDVDDRRRSTLGSIATIVGSGGGLLALGQLNLGGSTRVLIILSLLNKGMLRSLGTLDRSILMSVSSLGRGIPQSLESLDICLEGGLITSPTSLNRSFMTSLDVLDRRLLKSLNGLGRRFLTNLDSLNRGIVLVQIGQLWISRSKRKLLCSL